MLKINDSLQIAKKSPNGASICGEICENSAKFVTLVKLGADSCVNIVLKTESEESEKFILSAVKKLLTT